MWDSPEVAAEVADIAGPGAKLVRYDGIERFDVLPLLVATDGAIAAFGHDGRRLRPNIVIGGVEGLAEREWPGAMPADRRRADRGPGSAHALRHDILRPRHPGPG